MSTRIVVKTESGDPAYVDGEVDLTSSKEAIFINDLASGKKLKFKRNEVLYMLIGGKKVALR